MMCQDFMCQWSLVGVCDVFGVMCNGYDTYCGSCTWCVHNDDCAQSDDSTGCDCIAPLAEPVEGREL